MLRGDEAADAMLGHGGRHSGAAAFDRDRVVGAPRRGDDADRDRGNRDDCARACEQAGTTCSAPELPRPRLDAGPLAGIGIGRDGIAEHVEVETAHGATCNCLRKAARPRDACVFTVPTEHPSVSRHVRLGEVGDVAQHDDFALLRRESEQGALQVDALRVERRKVGGRGHDPRPLALPHPVDREVPGHSHHPRLGVRRNLRPAHQGTRQRLLGDVFRLTAVAQHDVRDAVRAAPEVVELTVEVVHEVPRR